MGQAVTIAVVDDQDVVLTGIQTWVAEDPEGRVEIVHTGKDFAALDSGAGASADVLIVDLRMEGELVFEQIAALVSAGRRVVVFSQHTEPDIIHRAELAGASAYITKESNEGRRHLIEAVLTVAAGGKYTTPSQAGAMLAANESFIKPKFSDQELRTMRLWLGGLTRAGVARQMGISEHTVKQYLERAREKYAKAGREVPTRLDLYREARRDGIVTD